MRISVKENPAVAERVRTVTVDGVDVTSRCFALDTEEGWADCFDRDERGNVYVGPSGDELAKARLTGAVVVDLIGVG